MLEMQVKNKKYIHFMSMNASFLIKKYMKPLQ
jgi:hypothetical protein